jgi:hypothetical protein
MSTQTLKPLYITLFILVVSLSSALAQTTAQVVAAAPWTIRPVGEGVQVKTHSFANLLGGRQDVYVAEATLSTPGVAVRFVGATGVNRVVSSHAGTLANTAVAVNGNWFHNAMPIQYTRIDGQVKAYTGSTAQERGGIVVSATGQVTCRTNPPGGWPSLTEPDVMASEVPLLVNGTPYQWTPEGAPDYAYYYTNRHPRTSIGVTQDNKVLLVVVDGRRTDSIGVSYAHMAELMSALGATNATVLDGGGSSTMWGRSLGVVNRPSDGSERAVATGIVITAPALPPAGDEPIIIESRSGGQNSTWYSETGVWADNAANCTAPGASPGIGQRYASTYRSVAGAKSAFFTPVLPSPGAYQVHVAWGAGGNRRDPVTYSVSHAGGVTQYFVNQAATANEWFVLGTHTFAAGNSGYVEISNADIDVSGSMYAAAARFVPVSAASVADWKKF